MKEFDRGADCKTGEELLDWINRIQRELAVFRRISLLDSLVIPHRQLRRIELAAESARQCVMNDLAKYCTLSNS